MRAPNRFLTNSLPMMFMSFVGCCVHVFSMLFFRDTIIVRSESVIQPSDRMNLGKFLTQHSLNIGSSFLYEQAFSFSKVRLESS